jgi:hypothetical protein
MCSLGLPAGLAVGFEQLPPALTLFPTHEKPEKLPDGAPQLIESSGMAKASRLRGVCV